MEKTQVQEAWEDGARYPFAAVEGKWQELPHCITDEMLEEWAVVATYDDLVPRFRERCGETYSTVLFDFPPALRRDEARVREIMQGLRAA